MRRSGHCRITSIHVMCVHIADTQGGQDALARAATVTMSFRCSMPRRMHRARAQPGATDDCMASARHHERRDSSGWWKGRENAGRRPRDNETHASRRGMTRKWCERKGHRARAARPSFGRRPEEGPGLMVPAMGSQRGHGFCSRFAHEQMCRRKIIQNNDALTVLRPISPAAGELARLTMPERALTTTLTRAHLVGSAWSAGSGRSP